MLRDKIKMYGRVGLVLVDENGNLKHEDEFDNLVVDVGLAYIASRMKDATATAMSHMGVGTSSTAAADAQTALQLPHADGRVALTSTTIVTTTVANDAVRYVATFDPGNSTGALTEAGIFNAASAGTMLCRTVFSVVNKAAGDTLTITWTVTVA